MASSDDPELEYLQPGFDPASLTMPKIRGILVAHSVPFPASAKKGQLVDIFNENIVPQARKILSARARTKRSTKGIVDVPSSQEASISDDEEQQRPARTPSRPSKKATPSSAAPSTSRKSRKSTSGTRADTDTTRTARVKTENDESPFSAENPFQTGSPPIARPDARNPSRRKTLGDDEKKERRKRSTSRRKTDGTSLESPSNAAPTSTRTRVSMPVSSLVKDEDVPAGEEFTPEEQQSLGLERRGRGQQPRPSRQPPNSKSRSFLKVAPWAALLAFSGGAATVWRQEKVQVGFCGIGRPSDMIAGVEIPPIADQLRPQCEPCPPHAYCHENLEVTCEQGFVQVPHPLSVRGLVPLPPTCEPDGEKARKVKAVADRAVEELRERNAQVECGELKDESGKRITTAEMEETKLKEAVASKRRKGMSQEEFEELWEPAIAEILSRDEIVSNEKGHPDSDDNDNTNTAHRPDDPASNQGAARRALRGSRRQPSPNTTLRSTSLANIPLACAIRRSIRHTLARHLGQLAAVVGITLAALYTRHTLAARRATEARAKQLASLALDRLAAQAALHARDPARFTESYVSMAQLRDDVLRDEFDAGRRRVLWGRVQSKVEGNANVRSSVRESRSGDVSRVWEWIGALDWLDLDEVASPARGGGGGAGGARQSLGGSAAGMSSPASGWRAATRHKEMEEVGGGGRTWEEARPAY